MRYRILGRTGLRASAIALGTGSLGTGWGHGAEPAEAREIYRRYRDVGGNFIDTANIYQGGESETLLGQIMQADRRDIILATKFSLAGAPNEGLLTTGNSRRAMVQATEESLSRLSTDWIDLLWVHVPDGVTPIDEIARALDDLVRSGKVLLVGLSNFPAWRVATAATLAELRGWAPVQAIQSEYSLVERTAERESLPMAAAFGIAPIAWSPLGGGVLTGKYRRGETGRREKLKVAIHVEDARTSAILDIVIEIAGELNVSPGQVSIAWVLAKGLFPIVGPRTADQLSDNLASANVNLSAEQIMRLDTVSASPLGAPHEKFGARQIADLVSGGKADLIDRPAIAPR